MRGQRRRAKGPRSGDDEVDVTPLGVHVREAAVGVVFGDPRGDRYSGDHLRPAGEEAAIAFRAGRGARLLAGHPLIAQMLDGQ
jgi:hypothetical protein